jgi:hypothetical protein
MKPKNSFKKVFTRRLPMAEVRTDRPSPECNTELGGNPMRRG